MQAHLNIHFLTYLYKILKCANYIHTHTHTVKYKNMHGEGHKGGFSLICYLLFLEKKKRPEAKMSKY